MWNEGEDAAARTRVGSTLLTILGIGVVLLPYFWMVSSSLKTGAEVFELPIRWIPRAPQWANYPNALARGAFGVYFFNSAFVALAVMAGNLPFCSLAGYGLAKFRFPYRGLFFRLHFVHADAAAGDHAGTDLPRGAPAWPRQHLWRLDYSFAVDAFGIFLMRQHIKDLPDSLIEAARLDGCSEFGIFWRIILPNCKPALGALALLTFRETGISFSGPSS